MSNYLLEMRNITKEFPGVKALDKVNLRIEAGTIHALVGENGAGKSTLMNVLSGIYPVGTYTGEIMYQGKVCEFKTIRDSESQGIAIIHQELALSPNLSIAENIFMGNEQQTKGVINWGATGKKAQELMDSLGITLDRNLLIKHIGVGHQQLVEIAKALGKNCNLLILDEPTAALSDEDSEKLLNLLSSLNKTQRLTCIIISHKLNEVTKIADAITVIRDGTTIETLTKGVDEITEERIITGMVGRELVERFPTRKNTIGETHFEVENWSVYDPLDEERQIIKKVNFHVKRGEILGIAGLMGAGRTELAMSIFGKSYGVHITGTLKKDGKKIDCKHVDQAIDHGIAYLTEDRKGAGLILSDDIRKNISLSNLWNIAQRGVVNTDIEIQEAKKFKEQLNIKCADIFQKTRNLSGGNQQKVVLAKWLFAEPDILILDEPTRGIDVGSKYEIYTIINSLAEQGKSVIVISSELPEILGISDRIYVMNEGAIIAEMLQEEASQERIMSSIIQSNKN